MRKVTVLALLLATAAPIAAWAQQTKTSQDTGMSELPGSGIITSQKSGEVLSDDYVGALVAARAPEGYESIGTVSELLLGPDDKIVGVVVEVGGILGVGAKPVGLSWDSLTEAQVDGALLLRTSLSRQDFEQAPEFKTLAVQQLEADQQMLDKESPAPTIPERKPPAQ